MPSSTRKDLIDAYQELDMLIGFYEDRNPSRAPECRHIIERVLPPRPRPTMAEVEWDDDKHYLAEAQHPVWGNVVMLNYDTDRAKIQYICYERPGRTGFAFPGNLTPTGYQCTLTEVHDA